MHQADRPTMRLKEALWPSAPSKSLNETGLWTEDKNHRMDLANHVIVNAYSHPVPGVLRA
jgi:hypothetical protein